MPRVENVGPSVDGWSRWYGEGSSTHDVCSGCYNILREDPHAFDNVLRPYRPGEPQGEDGWVKVWVQPEYGRDDSCKVCGSSLGR